MPFSFLFVSKGAEKAFSAELFASQASDDMFMAWRNSCSSRSNIVSVLYIIRCKGMRGNFHALNSYREDFIYPITLLSEIFGGGDV